MSSSAASNGQVRTTLTGRQLDYQHDALTNVMVGDAGFTSSTAGANLLPQGYTDNSLVRIPIKLSDLEADDDIQLMKQQSQPKQKKGFFRKMSGAFAPKTEGEIKMVPMSRGDYLKYWAKGEDGHFLPDVEEPAEGRREWVRKQLELDAQGKI